MRCRPSMRMSLTVNGANAVCAQAGSASAEARAKVSRRRDKGRVIRNILLWSGMGGGAACFGTGAGQAQAAPTAGNDGSRHQPQDVVVEGQARQPRDQREA